MEEKDVLQDDTDLPPQTFDCQVAYVVSIESNSSSVYVVEAGNEAGQCTLANAGRANQGDHRSGRNIQFDAAKHRLVLQVGEADVLEPNVAPGPARVFQGVRPVDDVRFLFQEFADPLRPCERLLNGLPGMTQMAHRLVEQLQVQEKRDQILDRKFADQCQSAPEVDYDNDAQRRCEMNERLEGRQQPERSQKRTLVVLDPDTDALGFHSLAGERLDFPNAGQIVLQNGVELTQLSLALSKGRTHILGEAAHGDDDEGNGNQGEQCQLGVHQQQHRADPYQSQDVYQHVGHCVGDQLFQQIRVIDHARHQLAGLFVLVVVQRQPLQMPVNRYPHIGDDAPASHMGHVAAQKLKPGPGCIDGKGQ